MRHSDHPKPVFSLFGYRPYVLTTPGFGVSLALIALAGTLLVGCSSGPDRDDDRARSGQELSDYAAQSAAVLAPDAGASAAQQPGRGWSVLVAIVPTNRVSDAEQMLGTVQASGLGDAYLTERSGRRAVVLGSFVDPASEGAQAALNRVRRTQVGGLAPFATAILIPPDAPQGGSGSDEFDLRSVYARLGNSAVYTLQVAVYGRADFEKPSAEDLEAFRKQAELAVAQMRSDGVEAYYYHGPNTSSVTVGIFDEDDHDGSTVPPVESARLRNIREQYPHNLLNGEGLMETVRTERGSVKRLQASRLVAVPKK